MRSAFEEQGTCFPAFGGLGAAFGVVVGFGPFWPRAFRFATRYREVAGKPIRGRQSGSGGKKQVKSVLHPPTHAGSPSRAHDWKFQQIRARALRFDRKFPPQSLAGTPVFKQIRHTVPFCAQRFFSYTVHGAFSF